MIKYVYSIDYPVGQKRSYLEWVRSIADTLQKPDELRHLASYDNVFSSSPQRVVEFSFDSLAEAATYFERPEIAKVFGAEPPPTRNEHRHHGAEAPERLFQGIGDAGVAPHEVPVMGERGRSSAPEQATVDAPTRRAGHA